MGLISGLSQYLGNAGLGSGDGNRTIVIAGGVGVAVAGTFFFTRPKASESQAHVTPWLGVGAAGVRGSF